MLTSAKCFRAAATANKHSDTQLAGVDTPGDGAAEPPLWTVARELLQERNALVLALTEMVCWRDTETRAHLRRVQGYTRCLAEEAARLPRFRARIDGDFIELIEWTAPLHDIGKVAVPDAILQKPGALDPAERLIVQQHTVVGARILDNAGRQSGCLGSFIAMAQNIARSHHEKFSGAGYPDRLVGDDIPLEARLVAVADVYDALRSPRAYKSGWSQDRVVHTMLEESPGHFDPDLLRVFAQCAGRFADIFDRWSD
jgi:putative two-component system response regulator